MLDRLSATLRFARAVSAARSCAVSAAHRLCCVGRMSAVGGSAVSAVHRLLAAALYRPRVGSAVSTACRLFAKALYRPHQQRRHVGRTEPSRVHAAQNRQCLGPLRVDCPIIGKFI